jgi:hypothetical protein
VPPFSMVDIQQGREAPRRSRRHASSRIRQEIRAPMVFPARTSPPQQDPNLVREPVLAAASAKVLRIPLGGQKEERP